MTLKQRLATWLLKAADMGGWNVMPWMQGRPYYPDVSYSALVKKYQSWVYACANKNAVSCAQIPLRLYAAKPTKKSKSQFQTRSISNERYKYLALSPSVGWRITKAAEVEEVLEHPFLDLMTNVNEFMNKFDLLEGLFLFQELTGNAYWQIIMNGMQVPQEIWPRMPQYIKIVPDKEKFISHYEFSITSIEKHVIEPELMVHFKYFNPQDVFLGMGPLEACVVAADLGVSMNAYETGLAENQARPDMALVLPVDAGEPSEPERKRMTKEWNQKFRGNKNAGKMTILTGGADLKQITLSPREMGFLQGRKWTLTEICAVYGVPLSKVTTDDVNRANAEAGDYSYMKDTILPRLRRVEQKINEQLLPMYDDRLFCAFDNPVPEDKDFRLEQAKARLGTGQTTINEERQLDGQEPVSWGEVPILPMNMVPLGTVAPQEPPIAPPGKRIKGRRTLPPLNHPTNFIDEEYVRALQGYFKEQGEEILVEFDKDVDMFKSTKDRASDFASAAFNKNKWEMELKKLMIPFESRTLASGGRAAIGSVSKRDFDVLNPEVINALEKHREGAVRKISDETAKNLRASLAAGLAEGDTIPDLRKRVVNVFEGAERYRATRIARTETIWAWNEGAVQGYKQSGIVEKKQWLSSADSRTCNFCPTMDGKTKSLDVYFFDKGDTLTVGESSLSFEYEDVGHPPLHPSCRCTIVPVIEEF